MRLDLEGQVWHGEPPRNQFTLRKLAMTTCVVMALIWFLLLPLVDHVITHSGMLDSSGDLERMGNAIWTYHDRFGMLPPAITFDADQRKMHSWRVLAAPPNTVPPAYQLSEPWDSENNRKTHPVVPYYFCFHCSRDPGPKNHTSYLAVTGPHTAFPKMKSTKIPEFLDVKKDKEAYLKFSGRGMTNTILAIESHRSGVHWMEPRDIDAESVLNSFGSKRTALSTSHAKYLYGFGPGTMALFADGSARFLNADTDPAVMKSLLEIDNREKSRERVGKFRP